MFPGKESYTRYVKHSCTNGSCAFNGRDNILVEMYYDPVEKTLYYIQDDNTRVGNTSSGKLICPLCHYRLKITDDGKDD